MNAKKGRYFLLACLVLIAADLFIAHLADSGRIRIEPSQEKPISLALIFPACVCLVTGLWFLFRRRA